MKSIDDAIVRAFQWVVDESQKESAWWGRVCCLVFSIGVVYQYAVQMRTGFGAGIGIMLAMVCFIITARPYQYRAVYGEGAFISAIRLVLSVLLVVDLLNWELMSKHALAMLCGIGETSFLFFASCNPPKPKPPKARMAGQGA